MKIVDIKKSMIAAMTICLLTVSCGGGNNNNKAKHNGNASEIKTEEYVTSKMEIVEPVKTFLRNTLPANYSFYTLKTYLPVEMNDLRSNGVFIGSRIPDGLLPPNVINVLYGGGFLSGTSVSLDEGTNGMDKFDGIKLMVLIGISPDGCVNSLRGDEAKSIILFSDEDVKKVTANDLVKVIIQ